MIVWRSLRILMLAVAVLAGCTVSNESGSSQTTSTPRNKAARENSKDQQLPTSGSILVDFEKGTVGGVNLRQDGEGLERNLGPNRVHKTTCPCGKAAALAAAGLVRAARAPQS